MKKITQTELVKEFFIKNSDRDIPHPEAVDWLTREYQRRTGKIFRVLALGRKPDRGIRKLAQAGFLIKIQKGIYRYDPRLETQKKLEDFTAEQKEQFK